MKTYRGHIADVVGRRFIDGEFDVENGIVTAIRECEGIDKNSYYFLPGFVDGHVHVESSMMLPSEFARIAMEHGSVAAICDPHEIANVMGIAGVELMLESSHTTPFHFMFGVPSCVPAIGGDVETGGAVLTADDVVALMSREDIGFLGEMMNFPGVLAGDESVLKKIQAAKDAGKPVDGHAPGLMGDQRRQYAAAGITTDHECTSLEEGRDAVASGMTVQIREGSAAKDFNALAPLIGEASGQVMFCTDDSHPDDFIKGHVDRIVRMAIKCGYDIFDILNAACVVPVKHYGLNVGLLQVGDPADFICLDNLRDDFAVRKTYIGGVKMYSSKGDPRVQERIAESCHKQLALIDKYNVKKMDAEFICPEDLAVNEDGPVHIILASDGSLLTGHEYGPVTPEVQKIVVYNRYSKGGKPSVGHIKGFGLKKGAWAQSIAHDCHNIVAVGTDDNQITDCINRVIAMGGGIAVHDGEQVRELALIVAGLMSPFTGHEIALRNIILLEHLKRTGCCLKAPLITLSFMALPVIPELKLTDRGFFSIVDGPIKD